MDDTSMDEAPDMLHISLDSAASEAPDDPHPGVEEDGQNNVLAEFSTLAADAQQYVLDESGNPMQVQVLIWVLKQTLDTHDFICALLQKGLKHLLYAVISHKCGLKKKNCA